MKPETRLEALESFQNLPGRLRRAVKLHLIYNVPPKEALLSAGWTRNLSRAWEAERVQTVLKDYAADDPADAAELAALATLVHPPEPPAEPVKAEKSAPERPAVAPESPRTDRQAEYVPPQAPEAPKPVSDPNEADRCGKCGLVLCGCARGVVAPPVAAAPEPTAPSAVVLDGVVAPENLFPGLTDANVAEWHNQVQAETDERRFLERQYAERLRRKQEML